MVHLRSRRSHRTRPFLSRFATLETTPNVVKKKIDPGDIVGSPRWVDGCPPSDGQGKPTERCEASLERRMGEMIPEQFPRGRPEKKRLGTPTFLEDMGITKYDSHCWQLEAVAAPNRGAEEVDSLSTPGAGRP